MDTGFWLSKWQSKQIGFHQDNIHPLLVKYWPTLELEEGSRVFVPLCGKSKDMLWLREQGHTVFGVDVSEVALQSFVRENEVPLISQSGNRYLASNIELSAQDIFSLDKQDLGEVRAVYERASLIALPRDMRIDYVECMRNLLQPGTSILLISLEYAEGLITPPPFSISCDEIERLYQPWCKVSRLETVASDVKGKPAREAVYHFRVTG